jgi:endoglycosylceramidase
MIGKMIQVAGTLFLSFCNYSYIKKLFWASDKSKIHFMTDKDGRISIYHGVNVSNYSKTASDFLPWQTKDDFARLKTWGFNLVRYLVFWQAVEPSKSYYDQQYMQKTLERIQWLQDLGIDVIIDVHQDLYSSKFTGNGFPDWTVYDNSLPFHCRTPWNLNYFEPAVVASYNYFWKSGDLKVRYINMLRHLLQNFDDFQNVIGIDVMNEPFPGTILSFEKDILTSFYEQVQSMMIDNNFKTEMFFEPMIFTSAGIPSNLKFDYRRDCCYFPHYYDAFCHEGANYTKANKCIMDKAFAIKLREAQNFEVPLLIGEFGISSFVTGHTQYLKDFVSIANENFIGWTYYTYDKKSADDFGILNNDGSETDLLKSIICVYPQKIAGKNPTLTYGEQNFTLEYDTDPSITGTTDIFIPPLNIIQISVNGTIVSSVSGQIFHHTNNNSNRQYISIVWSN